MCLWFNSILQQLALCVIDINYHFVCVAEINLNQNDKRNEVQNSLYTIRIMFGNGLVVKTLDSRLGESASYQQNFAVAQKSV